MDLEFEKFQAEMAAIEANNKLDEKVSSTATRAIKKRPISPKHQIQEPQNKRVIVSAPEVISAPPKRISQPPSYKGSSSTYSNPAALSGFLPGTGSVAQHEGVENRSSAPMVPVKRLNMVTGQPLPAEEQNMMSLQQSVYGYDPRKAGDKKGKAIPGAKKFVRVGGGEVWEDPTLAEWPENDFRLFCGDLGIEVSDEILAFAFSAYPTFQKAKVVREKKTFKSKGYGFVSFKDPFDCAKALREMNGKYIGNRPVKLSKSKWQDRDIKVAKTKVKRKRKNKNHLFN